jgi:hypothetical protein
MHGVKKSRKEAARPTNAASSFTQPSKAGSVTWKPKKTRSKPFEP